MHREKEGEQSDKCLLYIYMGYDSALRGEEKQSDKCLLSNLNQFCVLCNHIWLVHLNVGIARLNCFAGINPSIHAQATSLSSASRDAACGLGDSCGNKH